MVTEHTNNTETGNSSTQSNDNCNSKILAVENVTGMQSTRILAMKTK